MPSVSERSLRRSPAPVARRRRLGPTLAVLTTVAGCLCLGRGARAETVEPSYGRLEGDVTLVVGAGAALATGGPRVEGELRARYLESAGVFGTYEDGAMFGSSGSPRRVIAGGLELRPLFLYRWLRGHETRRARLDLAIDSIGLELGLTWQEPAGGPFVSTPGLQAGFGVEVPLLLDATGPWLAFHGGIRWSDETLASGVVDTSDHREAYLSITLAWHQVVSAHLVDVGDREPR